MFFNDGDQGTLESPLTTSSEVWNSAREVGQDPSDSKSSRLHVWHLLVLLYSFGVYSIDSSKMIGNPGYFSNSMGSSVSNL